MIGPAWIILDKFPNRCRTKRVKILSKLLFWLLLNALLAATQKFGIVGGVFDANYNETPPLPSKLPQALGGQANQTLQQLAPTAADPTGAGSLPTTTIAAASLASSQSHLNAAAAAAAAPPTDLLSPLSQSHLSSFPDPPPAMSLSLQGGSPSNHLAPLATTTSGPATVTVRLARRQATPDRAADSLSAAAMAGNSSSGGGGGSRAYSPNRTSGGRARERAKFYYEQLAQANGRIKAHDFRDRDDWADLAERQQWPASSACPDCDGYNISETLGGGREQRAATVEVGPPALGDTAGVAGGWPHYSARNGPDNSEEKEDEDEEDAGEVEYVSGAAAAELVLSDPLDGRHEAPDNNIVSKLNGIINSSGSGSGSNSGSGSGSGMNPGQVASGSGSALVQANAAASVLYDDELDGLDLYSPKAPPTGEANMSLSAGGPESGRHLGPSAGEQGQGFVRANIRREPREVGADSSGDDKGEQQLSEPSTSSPEAPERAASSSTRCKPRFLHTKKQSHIAVVFVCWILSVGIRIVS